MVPNPALGVVFHWLGGLASGSFYVPYRGVRKWAWEVYWLAGGFFSWIIAPWVLASLNTSDLLNVLRSAPASSLGWAYFWGAMWGSLNTSDLLNVLRSAPASSLGWAYFWGAMWGLGGLTFGLTMRYLGMSLGMAVALGYCAAFGTLMPPLFAGEFFSRVLGTTSGRVILGGVVICLLGIGIAGMAGMSKEKEMSEEEKKQTIREFSFGKGILVATFSGVMSACFAYALAAAEPVALLSAQAGTKPIWTGLPKLCIVLLGGFTSNFIWCCLLFARNRTGRQFFSAAASAESSEDCAGAPMLRNYLFSALAGTTWYLQFFFYSMGETQMGNYKFSSWTLHMASIIIFSSLWGIALHEWRGSSRRTRAKLALGLCTLILSTLVVGYGNYLGARPSAEAARNRGASESYIETRMPSQ
jgi:L-rhamnose-H+ transport protein